MDRRDPLATDPLKLARPVLTSQAKLTSSARLGNIKVELPVDAECGYSGPQHLVLCLDADYQASGADQLRFLAFMRDPVNITFGSERAAAGVRHLLEGRGLLAENVGFKVLQPTDCTGDCSRRITLEVQ